MVSIYIGSHAASICLQSIQVGIYCIVIFNRSLEIKAKALYAMCFFVYGYQRSKMKTNHICCAEYQRSNCQIDEVQPNYKWVSSLEIPHEYLD